MSLFPPYCRFRPTPHLHASFSTKTSATRQARSLGLSSATNSVVLEQGLRVQPTSRCPSLSVVESTSRASFPAVSTHFTPAWPPSQGLFRTAPLFHGTLLRQAVATATPPAGGQEELLTRAIGKSAYSGKLSSRRLDEWNGRDDALQGFVSLLLVFFFLSLFVLPYPPSPIPRAVAIQLALSISLPPGHELLAYEAASR